MMNGVLYTTAGEHRNAVAINAATGEMLWMHRLDEGKRAQLSSRRLSGRGVGYWTDGKGDERVFYVTIGYQLVGLDAKTGMPLKDFGVNGVVDLKKDADQDARSGRRRNGLERCAGRRKECRARRRCASRRRRRRAAARNAKGYIRAYDARTGKRRWIFHTIPHSRRVRQRHLARRVVGVHREHRRLDADDRGRRARHCLSAHGDPTGDYYGGHRPGNNLFAESLVAVDLQTGKRIWHYQFVHHPIWDYDMPCAPILVDITVNGRKIAAVAQPTKQGCIFVFDRKTGEPVWPIEERPVEKGTVPREWYSPTQPFPTRPPAFERRDSWRSK